MNKIKLIVAFLVCYTSVQAQQKPYYTQYILNNYILNPALSGVENYTDLKLSYRNQWTGIDGAPVTMYASVQGPLHKTDYRTSITSYAVPGENPRGAGYWEDYTAPDPHSGVGLIIMNDKTGYISRSALYGTYAYHKPVGPRTTLSLGFLAGVTNVSLDRSKMTLDDPNDLSIGYDNGEIKKLKPEIGAGLWLYSKSYFLGTSVLNIVPGKAKFVKVDKYGSAFAPQFFVTGGYRFLFGGDMSVLPSVLVQFINPEPIQTHLNVKIQYQDLLWFGGSLRLSDDLGGFAAMAGFNVGNTFNIGYAYDMSTNARLQTYTKSTHEVIIGFLIGNKYGDSCPRNVW